MKVRMRLISAILLTAVLFCTGCSVDVNSTASGAKKEEGTAEKKEEAAVETETDEGSEEDTGSEEIAEDEETGSQEISKKELAEIEKELNDVKYNGFVGTEFASPEDIWWNEVFYNGAGIGSSAYDDESVVKEYLKETGNDELFGELTCIDGNRVEKFVKSTTGYDYDQMKHPLKWPYLKKAGVYCHEHGDTNFVGVEVLSGQVQGDTCNIRYHYSSFGDEDPEFELVMKKNDGDWQFISNTWSPEEGVENAVKFMYDEVAERYAAALTEGCNRDECSDRNVSVHCAELIKKCGSDRNPMDVLGYCVEDIDDDGIDELIIGTGSEDGDTIFDMFTVRNGSLDRLFMTQEGEKYHLADDATFYHETANQSFGDILLHEKMDGAYKFLNEIDGVMYGKDPEKPDADPWYYSKDNYWDFEGTEHITKKEYDDYIDKAKASYVEIKYIPLSEYAVG